MCSPEIKRVCIEIKILMSNNSQSEIRNLSKKDRNFCIYNILLDDFKKLISNENYYTQILHYSIIINIDNVFYIYSSTRKEGIYHILNLFIYNNIREK